jgi:hypothetical protein
LLGVLLIGPDLGWAELLYFRGGGEAQLPAEVRGDVVEVESPAGRREFRKADFTAIIPGHDPAREWRERWAGVIQGDAEARYNAIVWGLGQGLISEGTEALRKVREQDQAFEGTRRLGTALAVLDMPWGEPAIALEELKSGLPGGRAQVAHSGHVVLIHQHEDEEAQERLGHLERVLTAYWLEMRRIGVVLEVPRAKLVVVWLREGKDYREYLRREGATAFLNTRGYYQPARRVVTLSDARSDPGRRAARSLLEAKAKELEALRSQVERIPRGASLRIEGRGRSAQVVDRNTAPGYLDGLRRELAKEELLWELDWRVLDLAVSAHELIHALVPATGLARRHDAFPNWLHEGLAMQFEAVRGGYWGGVDGVNSLRIQDWRTVPRPAVLNGLLRGIGMDQGYNQREYARSYAFVSYLRRERPEVWLRMLDCLMHPAAGKQPANARAREALVPDGEAESLQRLEAEWNTWVDRALIDPLDQNRPAGQPAPDARSNKTSFSNALFSGFGEQKWAYGSRRGGSERLFCERQRKREPSIDGDTSNTFRESNGRSAQVTYLSSEGSSPREAEA